MSQETPASPSGTVASVSVQPWPSEAPLFVLVLLVSLGFLGLLVVSIIGAIYAAIIAAAIFLGHLLLITHIRGSAIKLGPTQLPELYDRVQLLARRAGLAPIPDAYVLESGGALNAFATKLFRGRIIVLYTDLLEACGDDEAARDMVIGHELGHHKAGHLDWMWLIAPGMLVPLLGAAYSRAREFTCDRWGNALCGDAAGALRGLTILAAGGRLARRVDLNAFVAQKQDLDTGWMTLGRWLSTYPPLGERIEALAPQYGQGVVVRGQGPVRAAGILAGCMVIPSLVSVLAMALWLPLFRQIVTAGARPTPSFAASASGEDEDGAPSRIPAADVPAAYTTARADLERMAAAVERAAAAGFPINDDTTLGELWAAHGEEGPMPLDPFTGRAYEFVAEEDDETALVYSPGPDAVIATDDDLDRNISLPAAKRHP